VGKPEGKRPLGRSRRRWIDNIKVDLLEIGLKVVDWIGLAQDSYCWRALVNSVMTLRVPLNAGNYRVAAQLMASLAVLSSTELVMGAVNLLYILIFKRMPYTKVIAIRSWEFYLLNIIGIFPHLEIMNRSAP
jgi:hypothetical protein